MATATAPTDVFDKFNQNFSFEDDDESDYVPARLPTNFDKTATEHIQQAAAGGPPAPIPVNPAAPPAPAASDSELPEYFKDFENLLKEPFAKPEEKNYVLEAIQKFGPDYAHLDSREAIYDQSLYNESYNQFMKANPDYNDFKSVLNPDFDIDALIKENIYESMTKNFTYTDEAYKAQVDRFFTDGQLNTQGKKYAGELKQWYAAQVQQMEGRGKAEAQRKVADAKEYRATLDAEMKNFKPLGIELPEDLKTHVQEIIRSNKHKQEPKTHSEKAQREILMALASDPKAFFSFINTADGRAYLRGKNDANRQTFRNN